MTNNNKCLEREKLKNSLEITLHNQKIKSFIRTYERVSELEIGDTSYLPLIDRDFGLFPQVTYKEKLVIREDGYYIYAYETALSPFEEFDEVKKRFPAGWRLKGERKVNLDDIIGLFPRLTEKDFIRSLNEQIEQKKSDLGDYKKYGFMPYDTFGDKLLHHFANLMSKEIKWLRFLDFFD